jgi:hypothetical protein
MAVRAESWGDALALAKHLPETGGTVKLPDGTIIKVELVEDEPAQDDTTRGT